MTARRAPERGRERARRRLRGGLAVRIPLTLSYGYFDGGGADGNQNSRLALVYAVVDEGREAGYPAAGR
jgi:hypothetical protein